jgi:hypothetical protein
LLFSLGLSSFFLLAEWGTAIKILQCQQTAMLDDLREGNFCWDFEVDFKIFVTILGWG